MPNMVRLWFGNRKTTATWRQLDKTGQYLYLVGAFVTSWALMEMSMDYIAALIFLRFPAASAIHNELPRSLDQKIDFFSRAFAELPELSEFTADSAGLTARIVAMKDSRHDLVHGRVDSVMTGRARYVRLRLSGTRVHHATRYYTRRQIEALVSDANQLQYDLSLLSQRFRIGFNP